MSSPEGLDRTPAPAAASPEPAAGLEPWQYEPEQLSGDTKANEILTQHTGAIEHGLRHPIPDEKVGEIMRFAEEVKDKSFPTSSFGRYDERYISNFLRPATLEEETKNMYRIGTVAGWFLKTSPEDVIRGAVAQGDSKVLASVVVVGTLWREAARRRSTGSEAERRRDVMIGDTVRVFALAKLFDADSKRADAQVWSEAHAARVKGLLKELDPYINSDAIPPAYRESYSNTVTALRGKLDSREKAFESIVEAQVIATPVPKTSTRNEAHAKKPTVEAAPAAVTTANTFSRNRRARLNEKSEKAKQLLDQWKIYVDSQPEGEQIAALKNGEQQLTPEFLAKLTRAGAQELHGSSADPVVASQLLKGVEDQMKYSGRLEDVAFVRYFGGGAERMLTRSMAAGGWWRMTKAYVAETGARLRSYGLRHPVKAVSDAWRSVTGSLETRVMNARASAANTLQTLAGRSDFAEHAQLLSRLGDEYELINARELALQAEQKHVAEEVRVVSRYAFKVAHKVDKIGGQIIHEKALRPVRQAAKRVVVGVVGIPRKRRERRARVRAESLRVQRAATEYAEAQRKVAEEKQAQKLRELELQVRLAEAKAAKAQGRQTGTK